MSNPPIKLSDFSSLLLASGLVGCGALARRGVASALAFVLVACSGGEESPASNPGDTTGGTSAVPGAGSQSDTNNVELANGSDGATAGAGEFDSSNAANATDQSSTQDPSDAEAESEGAGTAAASDSNGAVGGGNADGQSNGQDSTPTGSNGTAGAGFGFGAPDNSGPDSNSGGAGSGGTSSGDTGSGDAGSASGGTDGGSPGDQAQAGASSMSGEPKADGENCASADECESGVCEGLGCGDTGGTCASALRPCTLDYVQFCGCDGRTFGNSSSCPGARYEHEGPCDGGGSNDACAGYGESCVGTPCCDGLICNGEASACL